VGSAWQHSAERNGHLDALTIRNIHRQEIILRGEAFPVCDYGGIQ
jgi:hypothetical protein